MFLIQSNLNLKTGKNPRLQSLKELVFKQVEGGVSSCGGKLKIRYVYDLESGQIVRQGYSIWITDKHRCRVLKQTSFDAGGSPCGMTDNFSLLQAMDWVAGEQPHSTLDIQTQRPHVVAVDF